MGLGRSLLDSFEPFGTSGAAADTYQAVITNLSSIVLFGALVVFKRLDEVGGSSSGGSGLALGILRIVTRADRPGRRCGTS